MRAAIALSLIVMLAGAALADGPPSGWPKDLYSYTPNVKLAVEETTPTPQQAGEAGRPPQLPAHPPPPVASTQPAPPRVVGPMNVVHVRFRDALQQDVTALLCTPKDKTGPFPLVIATHARGGDKARICAQLAPALAAAGFALLAADLPFHGEQPGDPENFLHTGDLRPMFPGLKRAVIDVRQCIDLAEHRPELDTKWGVILMGVSLGTVVDTFAGPADRRVKGMCLFSAGTHEFPVNALDVQIYAAMDSQLSIAYFAPRRLLMLSGTQDAVCTPEMARRLFAAAREPKQQVWYDAAHGLTPKADQDAAAFAAEVYHQAKP